MRTDAAIKIQSVHRGKAGRLRHAVHEAEARGARPSILTPPASTTATAKAPGGLGDSLEYEGNEHDEAAIRIQAARRGQKERKGTC